jgi:hypothetical protein
MPIGDAVVHNISMSSPLTVDNIDIVPPSALPSTAGSAAPRLAPLTSHSGNAWALLAPIAIRLIATALSNSALIPRLDLIEIPRFEFRLSVGSGSAFEPPWQPSHRAIAQSSFSNSRFLLRH